MQSIKFSWQFLLIRDWERMLKVQIREDIFRYMSLSVHVTSLLCPSQSVEIEAHIRKLIVHKQFIVDFLQCFSSGGSFNPICS